MSCGPFLGHDFRYGSLVRKKDGIYSNVDFFPFVSAKFLTISLMGILRIEYFSATIENKSWLGILSEILDYLIYELREAD